MVMNPRPPPISSSHHDLYGDRTTSQALSNHEFISAARGSFPLTAHIEREYPRVTSTGTGGYRIGFRGHARRDGTGQVDAMPERGLYENESSNIARIATDFGAFPTQASAHAFTNALAHVIVFRLPSWHFASPNLIGPPCP